MQPAPETTRSQALKTAWVRLLVEGAGLRTVIQEVFREAGLKPADRLSLSAELRALCARRHTLEFALGGDPSAAEPRARALLAVHGFLERGTRQHHDDLLIDWGHVQSWQQRLTAVDCATERFRIRHALPRWAAERILAEDEPESLARALLDPPPRTLRVHRRMIGRLELQERLRAEGLPTIEGRFAETALLAPALSDPLGTAAWSEGLFELQDEASQLCALLVAPPPRGKVLDGCAGTGGKSLALADLLQDRGKVMALDPSPARLTAMKRRARRADASNLRPLATPLDHWPEEAQTFAGHADRILLDLPCSGLGALRRHPEGRWTLNAAELEAFGAVQAELVRRAASALKPGARLIVATCTFGHVENAAVVEALLADDPGLEVVLPKEILGRALADPLTRGDERWLQLRPDHHGTDGFFAAVVRRRRQSKAP